MRILEKIVFKQEIYPQGKKVIDDDQFVYKEGTSTTTALIKCQHNWLKWLIPLRATAVKFVASNSFRSRYVRQPSSSLRPTALKFAMSNSFRFRYVRQL